MKEQIVRKIIDLHYNSGSCGVCVSRCSGGAITARGYDNELCYRHNRSPQYVALRAEYGIEKTGCSLCQTKVPCEKSIPVQKRSDRGLERSEKVSGI